jgi:hypothetical protein
MTPTRVNPARSKSGLAWPIAVSVSTHGTGHDRHASRTNPAAIPAPRNVGCSTTRASSQSCSLSADRATRDRGSVSPKNRLRRLSDAAGVVNTHTPAGSSPCLSTTTRLTNARWCDR